MKLQKKNCLFMYIIITLSFILISVLVIKFSKKQFKISEFFDAEVTAQDNTLQETTSQDNTLQETTSQDNTLQETTSQDNTLQETTSQDNTLQETTSQDNTLQETTSQDNTLQETTLQENTLQENTLQENTLQENTLQDNTDGYNTSESIYSIPSEIIDENRGFTQNEINSENINIGIPSEYGGDLVISDPTEYDTIISEELDEELEEETFPVGGIDYEESYDKQNTNASNKNASNKNASNRNASNRNASNRNASNRNASNKNASNRNASNTNASNTNASNINAPNRNAPNRNASNRNASNRNASNRNAPNRNAPNRNAPNRNASNRNAPNRNAPNRNNNIYDDSMSKNLVNVDSIKNSKHYQSALIPAINDKCRYHDGYYHDYNNPEYCRKCIPGEFINDDNTCEKCDTSVGEYSNQFNSKECSRCDIDEILDLDKSNKIYNYRCSKCNFDNPDFNNHKNYYKCLDKKFKKIHNRLDSINDKNKNQNRILSELDYI